MLYANFVIEIPRIKHILTKLIFKFMSVCNRMDKNYKERRVL